MAKHLIDVILITFYYFGLLYFVFCECSYFYFKHIKKDDRLKNIGFFKYLNSSIRILKGDK